MSGESGDGASPGGSGFGAEGGSPAPFPGLPARFRLERTLGVGAFGDVYLAFDELLERRVCVKLLRPAREATPEAREARERFLREAQAAAKLEHPNIVAVHDVVEWDGRLAIVMEYVEGVTLRERLLQTGRLPFGEAMAVARAVATGLDYAHDHGIVHRDVKPANVFLASDGGVKVGDFGLAYMLDKPKLTSSGVVGTPAYMSPEQARGLALDRRSDVFSVGCLLYEMLTGEQPFADPSIPTVLFKIVYEEPRALASFGLTLPPFLEGVMARALAKDPRRRYQRASDLAADLGGESTARTPIEKLRPARRPSSWVFRGLALAAALAAIGGLVVLVHSPRRAFVAVLPFENATGNADFAFVARGLPAEIARQLAEERGVTIVPTGDVLEQLGKGLPLREAGRRAGATSVLSGTIEARGRALIIGYSLLEVGRGTAHTGSAVASLSNLQRPLAEVRRQALSWLGLESGWRSATLDPQAFELYVKGSDRTDDLELGKEQAYAEARALLERALAIEPSVEIYAGLARLHFEAVNASVSPSRENLELCRYYLAKGLALKPDYLPLLETRTYLDLEEGRLEEGLAVAAGQLLADRISPTFIGSIGTLLRQNGDYALAESFYRLSVRLFPEDYLQRLNLCRCLFQSGRRDEALALMRGLALDFPNRTWPRYDAAAFALIMGDVTAARRGVETLPSSLPSQLLGYQVAHAEGERVPFEPGPRILAQAEVDFDTCLLVAEDYALSGNQTMALRYFRKTLDLGWWAWAYFDRDPMLESLRDSEEYRQWRAEGLERQRQRRERERAVLRPVLTKLGIAAPD